MDNLTFVMLFDSYNGLKMASNVRGTHTKFKLFAILVKKRVIYEKAKS